MRSLRVCLDARGDFGEAGGVEQFIVGLADGLREVAAEGEEFRFLVYRDSAAWLEPHVGGRLSLLRVDRELLRRSGASIASRVPRPLRRWLDCNVAPFAMAAARQPGYEAFERERFDAVHFTRQVGFATATPSVYHPHDLQHVHLPQYFTPAERYFRTIVYRRYAQRAKVVVATSSWCREDFIRHLDLAPEKVRVVPLAPPTAAYGRAANSAGDDDEVAFRLGVGSGFLLFPAQTWPHKNHLALVEALGLLRTEGVLPEVVFSGRKTEHAAAVEARAAELKVDRQIRFVGFVSPADLQWLYRRSRGVVIPTLFEAASFPIWEAWLAGRPVACSNVTSLPKQAGAAALVFDPNDVSDIARTVRRLWTDEGARRDLSARGSERLKLFSWAKTAKLMRACYRIAAGYSLSVEEQSLLDAEPLL